MLILSGKKLPKPHTNIPPWELQAILTSISSLQQNNQVLISLQQKSRYSLTQSYLRSLLLNINDDDPSMKLERLKELQLSFLHQERLCMAVIKIDNYTAFLQSHDTSELWIVRFCVVNIIKELAGACFTCNALLSKMRFGHNCIIDPYQLEEISQVLCR